MDEGQVFFLHLAVLELIRQNAVRPAVFCHQHDAAGVFIQTVNDPRSRGISGGQGTHPVKKRVDECAGADPGARMAHEAGRFVDHRKIGVLIENIQWNVFGKRLIRRRPGQA